LGENVADIEKLKSVFDYQVTFSDCDPAALSYYGRIIEWCDWSTEKMWRDAGLPWHTFFNRDGMGSMPLLDVHISFHFPMRHGDKLKITTWIEEFSGRTFTTRHEIMNGEHLSATSAEKRAWIVPAPETEKGIKAVQVPGEVQATFHKPVG
jgi:YbgC/YbaW family acyl-CoA thioester hydrolase